MAPLEEILLGRRSIRTGKCKAVDSAALLVVVEEGKTPHFIHVMCFSMNTKFNGAEETYIVC